MYVFVENDNWIFCHYSYAITNAFWCKQTYFNIHFLTPTYNLYFWLGLGFIWINANHNTNDFSRIEYQWNIKLHEMEARPDLFGIMPASNQVYIGALLRHVDVMVVLLESVGSRDAFLGLIRWVITLIFF
jgi:hypothetical protein